LREYETTFIVQPEISDEGIAGLFERLDAVMEKSNAQKLLYDDQGKRRLAFEIENFQKGRYVTLYYLDEGRTGAEIERVLRLDDSVLRFLTVLANDEVSDVEARKAEAAEFERVRAQKAAERAAREAEDAARAAESEKAAAEAAESSSDSDDDEAAADSDGNGDDDDREEREG
jgi:small subunit ribosomal protein S6